MAEKNRSDEAHYETTGAYIGALRRIGDGSAVEMARRKELINKAMRAVYLPVALEAAAALEKIVGAISSQGWRGGPEDELDTRTYEVVAKGRHGEIVDLLLAFIPDPPTTQTLPTQIQYGLRATANVSYGPVVEHVPLSVQVLSGNLGHPRLQLETLRRQIFKGLRSILEPQGATRFRL